MKNIFHAPYLRASHLLTMILISGALISCTAQPTAQSAAPTGAAPTGAAPTGAAPTGAAPTGAAPTGAAPTVVMPVDVSTPTQTVVAPLPDTPVAATIAPTDVSAALVTNTPEPAQQPTMAPQASSAATPNSTNTTEPAPTYFFPVQPANIARYGTCHHDYPASDIFAPIGSAFVAVTDGVVDYVSATDPWSRRTDDPATRGGLSVAIIGNDGVRYYGSHLSAVADGITPGVRVSAGQLLGRTGDSGNAAGTPPHLHFGISRPTQPDDWAVRRGVINPWRYLNAWKQGKPLTPDLAIVGGGSC